MKKPKPQKKTKIARSTTVRLTWVGSKIKRTPSIKRYK